MRDPFGELARLLFIQKPIRTDYFSEREGLLVHADNPGGANTIGLLQFHRVVFPSRYDHTK